VSPLERIQERANVLGLEPKHAGNGYSCRCPAHEDRNPSLSFTSGRDGRAVLHCHAGCEPDAVVRALGLTWAELSPDAPAAPTTSRKPTRLFPTANAALTELRRSKGTESGKWRYDNGEGEPVGLVARWDEPGGKCYLQFAREGNGWKLGAMPKPRPLYSLGELLGRPAERVYVTEGEKAADAVRSVGLLATTVCGSRGGIAGADLSPLAGRELVVLPDRDEAGERFAEELVARLEGLAPPARVHVVRLPGLPESGDFVEFLEAHGGDGPAARAALERASEPAEAAAESEEPKWEPFPVEELFPPALADFIRAGSVALDVDPAYVALPLVAAAGAAVGDSLRVELAPEWLESACLWTLVVAEPSTRKSQALGLATFAVDERQAELSESHRHSLEAWELEHAEAKRLPKGKRPPMREPPPMPQAVASDTTTEALGPLWTVNPRGFLVRVDEAAGWFDSFDLYRAGGKGSPDLSRWLSVYGHSPIMANRVSRAVHVPRPFASFAGTIQPGAFRRCMSPEFLERGLGARFIVARPPRRPKRPRKERIDREPTRACFRALYSLQLPEAGPRVLPLEPDASEAWDGFVTEWGEFTFRHEGSSASCLARLEQAAGRFALLHHALAWAEERANGRRAEPGAVTLRSVEAGLRFARWAWAEWQRVLPELEREPMPPAAGWTLTRLGASPEGLTARELLHAGRSRFRNVEEARHQLETLARLGQVRREYVPPGPSGGRDSVRFHLQRNGTPNG
jgi:hypothetical protein